MDPLKTNKGLTFRYYNRLRISALKRFTRYRFLQPKKMTIRTRNLSSKVQTLFLKDSLE